VLVHRAYRHKLALTPEQEALCRRIAGCCRLVFNAALEQRQVGYLATGRGISYMAQTYGLAQVKREPGFEFLTEAPAHCLQQAMADVQDAYARFFKGQNRYPAYRRRGENDSFRFPDPDPKQIGAHNPVRQGQVRLPKLGWVSVRNAYPRLAGPPSEPLLYEGELKSVTVKREADGWYVSFCCVVEVPLRPLAVEPAQAVPVGIDRGVANSVALSTGELFHLPVITQREWERIGNLQSVVNRRVKGSRNRERALRRLKQLRRRLVLRKHDAIEKLTTSIIGRHPLIALEHLRIAGVTASAKGTAQDPGSGVAQKAGLNRAILDQCWGEFERQLSYKALWSGRALWKVPAKNSSRQCSNCGHTGKENRESQAVFACQACGFEQHADINAACVVLDRALRGEGKLVVDGAAEHREAALVAIARETVRPSGGTPGCGEAGPRAPGTETPVRTRSC
jgi:putative transposase